jgi:hypothetical protein
MAGSLKHTDATPALSSEWHRDGSARFVRYPKASWVEAFSQAQLHLYRHDISLQDYFEALQFDTLTSPRARSREQSASLRLFAWATRGANKVSQFRSRPRMKADVLFCPMPHFSEPSTRCELSHPAWSLEDDLRRSSAVVGILSGVLTVASACGLPTFFLETEQGFTNADLACFSPVKRCCLTLHFPESGNS